MKKYYANWKSNIEQKLDDFVCVQQPFQCFMEHVVDFLFEIQIHILSDITKQLIHSEMLFIALSCSLSLH